MHQKVLTCSSFCPSNNPISWELLLFSVLQMRKLSWGRFNDAHKDTQLANCRTRNPYVFRVYALNQHIIYLYKISLGFPGVSDNKESACKRDTWVWFLGLEDPLKKGMATHSTILAWRIPWTEEPGRLQSMALQRVGHDWSVNSHTHRRSLCTIFWLFSYRGTLSFPGKLVWVIKKHKLTHLSF